MDAASLDLANTNFALTAPKQPAHRDPAKAARDFEAVFIAQMFEQMWEQVSPGDMSGGTGERIFRSLMNQSIAQQMADNGGIGLAANVQRELLALQESARQ